MSDWLVTPRAHEGDEILMKNVTLDAAASEAGFRTNWHRPLNYSFRIVQGDHPDRYHVVRR